MELKQSQLEYIKKRKKNYNLKYSIMNKIITDYFFNNCKILEIFGGIGIDSFYINLNIKPLSHTILEIDDNCIKILKNFKNLIIKKQDAFNYSNFNNLDFIIIDNAFCLSKMNDFVPIFKRIKSSNFQGKIILTETGIFNLKFNKEKTPEEHFNNYKEFFNSFGLIINKVYYTISFSRMVLSYINNPNNKIKIIKWNKEDDRWKEYTANILKNN